MEGHADISLSPILWHALDVWQCSKQGYESLHEAMEDLLNCSTEFDTDHWYIYMSYSGKFWCGANFVYFICSIPYVKIK